MGRRDFMWTWRFITFDIGDLHHREQKTFCRKQQVSCGKEAKNRLAVCYCCCFCGHQPLSCSTQEQLPVFCSTGGPRHSSTLYLFYGQGDAVDQFCHTSLNFTKFIRRCQTCNINSSRASTHGCRDTILR